MLKSWTLEIVTGDEMPLKALELVYIMKALRKVLLLLINWRE